VWINRFNLTYIELKYQSLYVSSYFIHKIKICVDKQWKSVIFFNYKVQVSKTKFVFNVQQLKLSI